MNRDKKVFFVNPPNDMKKESNFSIGLFSLATILKKKGYPVRVLDIDYLITTKEIDNKDIHSICDYILDLKPDILDFYTMSNSYYFTIKLSKMIKDRNKDIKIIFGGPQATLVAKETLLNCRWIDAIGLGEGELTILSIIDKLANEEEFHNEKGLAYRKDDEIIINQYNLLENLDELPMLDFSLLEGKIENRFDIDVGRGCPFGCKYCSTKTFWKRNFRLKSSKRIIDEIIYLKNTYGINKFGFEHDLFTVNKKKVIEFCNKVKDIDFNIIWGCSSRADTLDEELIKAMKEAGCYGIFLGIETGSSRMQKIVNKNLDINRALETVILLKNYGIEITASLIYGFPEETEYDLNCTIELIYKLIKLDVNMVQLHLFSLYPGTEYYEELKDKVYLSRNFSDAANSEYLDEEAMKFIEENKELFPQYLDFDLGIRKEFELLDIYIYRYARVFIRYMGRTYDALVNIYKGHTNLFKSFKYVNEESLKEYKNKINKMILDPKAAIKDVGNLISVTEYEYKDVLEELFRFECDIVNFVYYSTEKELKITYKYDVYYLKSGKISIEEADECSTSIIFRRENEKNDLTIVRG